MRSAEFAGGFAGWRSAARALLIAECEPACVVWRPVESGQWSLLPLAHVGDAEPNGLAGPRDPASVAAAAPTGPPRVPRDFLTLAAAVACHRDGSRWDTLYRVLWRLTHGEPALLDVLTDPDVHRLEAMRRAVKRAVHKMHAFVRFRSVHTERGPEYVAWFEPAHDVVERATPFFARRFAAMRWTILTPERCAQWDGDALRFSAGVTRDAAPASDSLEELWRTYYTHIFNPARLALGTMRAEMPKQYWANLPEARLIGPLARDAASRVRAMLAQIEAPAESIPDEMRARAGAERERRFEARRDAPLGRPAVRRTADPAYLALPNAWDPVHDPGTVTAHARDAAVPHDAPAGLVLDGVHVAHGVAGWTDPSLLAPGVFYPPDATTPEARLRYYASRYPMVEVDATYYALPARSTAAAWADRTPPHFTFDVKAFALTTTHATELRRLPDWLRRALPSRLADSALVSGLDLPDELRAELWRRFLSALEPLRSVNKLGAIYLQFPRWFQPSPSAARYLRWTREQLGDAVGAVEFRNPAWMAERVGPRTLGLLRDLELAYTIVDAPPGTRSSMPPTVAVTSPTLIVLRLHGRRTATWEARNDPVSERYRYLYDRDELSFWAPRIRDAIASARAASALPRVRLSFNNNHANYGAVNARELASMLVDEGAAIV